jgi:hypothetical protein
MDGGSCTRDSEKKVRLYFIWRPCLLGLWKVCKRKLWKLASLSIGAHWRTQSGAHLPGTLQIQMKEGSGNGASLDGSSLRGTWREGSSTGGPGRYIKEGSGEGHRFPYGPQWGAWRAGSFTGDFKRQ